MNELFSLQFLRPYWLLALLPVAWLLWKLWQIKQKQGAWHKVIAPQFQPLLLGKNATKPHTLNHTLGFIGFGLVWLMTIIVLAGPSTQSVEMPAQKNQQGTVIVLDLSLSMLADDLSPNRLARVKYKITDLLTQHPELAIGLIGYAGSAHSISPISEDNQTLLSLLPALNPVLMPRYGSKPLLGLQKADELFKGARINHGHIIWITDDIEPHEVPQLKQWMQNHDYSVSILTVGTPQGGAVHIPNYGLLKDDNGKIISPPLPLKRFQAFAEVNKVTLSHFNISDQSLSPLLPPALPVLSQAKQNDQDEMRLVLPLDQGIYLLLLLLPLVALLFRRGWVLSLSALSLPLVGLLSASVLSAGLFIPNTSYAEEKLPSLSEVFKTPDQLGYQAWQENNLKAAESLFEDPQWRASSLYKQGKYPEAAELFRQDISPRGHYNLGNALAKSGDLEAAKQAYETALKQQPTFAPAQQNLDIIKQLLAQQQSEQKKQQESQKQKDNKKGQSKEAKSNDADQSQEKGQKSDSSDNKQNQSNQKEGEDSNQQGQNEENQPNNDSNSNKQNNPGEKEGAEEKESKLNQADQNDLKNEDVPQPSADKNQPSDEASDQDRVQDSESSEAHQSQTERNAGKLDKQHNQTSPTQKTQPLSAKEQEQQRAMQNWLKQIPDEPGLFLKRKFEYQYQQQSSQPQSNQDGKAW
jgi:Ca-activated chloride channel family protein